MKHRAPQDPAAKTAVFQGVSAEDFRRHYLPVCRSLATDNAIGKVIFAVTKLNLVFEVHADEFSALKSLRASVGD